MSYQIAITGKGGVGKTTLAGLLVQRLIAADKRPVLAVDADPNTCLDEVLGVNAEVTIGRVREDAREIASKGMAGGISKQQLLELKISESLVEADDFDLIAMGRSEGAGCYCYANNVLKMALGTIAESYPYVILDNEAGLENLSRRIYQEVDLLILVADPSKRGLNTVRRLHQLTAEMDVKYGKLAVVVNRVRNELPDYALSLKADIGADFLIALPDDNELHEFAEAGRSLTELPSTNAVATILDGFLSDLQLH
ncbi:hypothetical protein BVY04_01900 [bacterium M21]|nr:hypothetical protein BVY04_01900 [bacterium M21]